MGGVKMGGRRPGDVGLLAELVAFPLRDPSSEGRFVTRALFTCRAPFVWLKWRFDGLSGAITPLYESRWALLEEAANSASLQGLHLEFGVFKGESINFLAQKFPCQWYGFDSFEGLPRKWTPGYGREAFNMGGIAPPVTDNVRLVRGWFSETLPRFLDSVGKAKVSFLHVDSDLYESAQSIFTDLDARISEGTVIVFDEYTGLTPDDEARAFREWRRRARARFQFIGCARHGSVAVRILQREPSPARTVTQEPGI